MDTREKIVPVEDLAARLNGQRWTGVVGTFDPLTLAQAERLTQFGVAEKPVLAVVEPGTGCLLPVEARAILVAALKSVQLVVVSPAEALAGFQQIELVKDEAGERERSASFVEHVRQRQGAK